MNSKRAPVTHWSMWRIVCAVALGSVLLPAGAGASSVVITSSSAISNPFGAENDYDQLIGADGELVQVSSSSMRGGAVFSSVPPFPPVGQQTASGASFASATEGVLAARASATSETPGLVQNAAIAEARATASWSDLLTITAAGMNGQTGTITASVLLSGTFGGGVGGFGAADWPFFDTHVQVMGTGMPAADTSQMPAPLAGVCNGWAYCGRAFEDRNPGAALPSAFSGSNLPATGILAVTIPITFGSGTTLDYRLQVFARGDAATFAGGNGTAGGGESDYASTLQWGGITGVFDSNGAPVSSFTASSRSGFDYVTVVPEPGTTSLLMTGLLSVAVASRARAPR
jgi:hypothetical protein